MHSLKQFSAILLLLMGAMVFVSFSEMEEVYDGYVILKDGKKIEGKVIPGTMIDNEIKITFLHQKKRLVYKPKNLKGYGYEELKKDKGMLSHQWKHFEVMTVEDPPKIFGPTDVFIQRTETGAINLYSYYVEQRSNYKAPIKLYYFIKDTKGKLIPVQRDSYKQLAKKLFVDYTALTVQIGSKMFEYESMDRMVRDYNFWIKNQHSKDDYRVAPNYFGTKS